MPVAIPSQLVIDACVLFSIFKSDSARRDVFRKLQECECTLLSPDYVLDELSTLKLRIAKSACINESAFDEIFSELHDAIDTVPKESYEPFIENLGIRIRRNAEGISCTQNLLILLYLGLQTEIFNPRNSRSGRGA